MAVPRNGCPLCRVLMAAVLLVYTATLPAGDGELRRALVGAKVFAAFLAADQGLLERRAADGSLTLLLIHRGELEAVQRVRERLQALGSIRGAPLAVRALEAQALEDYDGPPAAGVFIAEWLPDLELPRAFARAQGVLLFSPFLGDVDRGAQGGLHVSDRILPLLNPSELDAARIRLKPFFLDVSKHHEP